MALRFVRRRRLGRGSTNGILAALPEAVHASVVCSWIPEQVVTILPDDVVVRWGCTANLPAHHKTLNTAAAIHWCADKRAGRLAMQEAGVPVPETVAVGDGNQMVPYPLTQDRWVGRPVRHAQGRNLVVGSTAECVRQVALWGGGYISRLIQKVAEYRFFVAFNRVVWCARKTPGNPDQVAWNVAQGGRFDNVRWEEWPIGAAKACLAAARVSGADFCGVDVMVDADGAPYVLEVNSAPSQTSPYRQRCVANALAYHVSRGDFTHLPDPANIRTYKSIIHPAIREPRT